MQRIWTPINLIELFLLLEPFFLWPELLSEPESNKLLHTGLAPWTIARDLVNSGHESATDDIIFTVPFTSLILDKEILLKGPAQEIEPPMYLTLSNPETEVNALLLDMRNVPLI